MHRVRAAASRRERLEPGEPLHRLDRRRPVRQGRRRRRRRPASCSKAEGYTFDLAFTSVLKRAIRTLWIALDEMDLMWIPVERSWRLNERHYGALQGLNKAETAAKFGEDQVKIWRRSYDIPPPALEPERPALPRQRPPLPGAVARRAAARPSASRTPSRDSCRTGTGRSPRRSSRASGSSSPPTATACARW